MRRYRDPVRARCSGTAGVTLTSRRTGAGAGGKGMGTTLEGLPRTTGFGAKASRREVAEGMMSSLTAALMSSKVGCVRPALPARYVAAESTLSTNAAPSWPRAQPTRNLIAGAGKNGARCTASV